MLSPSEARRALALVTDAAVSEAVGLSAMGANAIAQGIPAVISEYSLASATLSADYYDDLRLAAGAGGRYAARPIIPDRAEKIRRAALWAVKPLSDQSIQQSAESRIAEVVQLEVARAHRETTLQNVYADPESLGWSRITRAGACNFCRMLAEKGAIYKKETARFAAHENCNCAAQAWFKGQRVGEEADALQYVASGRVRTAEEKARLRNYLDGMPDAVEPASTPGFGRVLKDGQDVDLAIGPISDGEWEDAWPIHRANSDFRYIENPDARAQALLMYQTDVGEQVKAAAANVKAGRGPLDGVDIDRNIRFRDIPQWKAYEADGYGRPDFAADVEAGGRWLASKTPEAIGAPVYRGVNFPLEASWDEVRKGIDLNGWNFSSTSTKETTALRYAGRPDRSKSVLMKIEGAEGIKLPGVGNFSNTEEVLVSGRIQVTSSRLIPDPEGYGERLLLEARWTP